MKALIIERNGEPSEVVHWRDLPAPTPGPAEVRVAMLLVPVHPSDLHVIRGRFARQRQPELPASPGSEGVGIIDAVGSDVPRTRIGERVVLLNVPGTWREQVISPAERAIPVPAAISDEDAAQALINPMTAWAMTICEHKLGRGDWLVQSAAGSAVGRLVLQIARTQGFRTINLVRREEQVAEIQALGGDVVLCTAHEGWPDQLRQAIGGDGITSAIDCVAGRTGATLARQLAPNGRLLVYGALSSHRQNDAAAFEMPIFAPALIYSSAEVRGWLIFSWLAREGVGGGSWTLRSLLDRMAEGTLKPPAARCYRVDCVLEAFAAAESAAHDAKPLLAFTER
ncbi:MULTISPECIES: zinc-dependent alcohol dehydrogenase family protein [unclassified Caballeronia]|uniref:zinc-dependent alcohol dehydrogenase family protein n=1 Tax=unclassified Caballeronia TaxID=2646786 RepID=UPI002858041F|nr:MULTISPECIES: zinc-dependent alcohol dehydrogenase family protein [unclassified Caballeronia]MDR5755028.1 zinc-dependent alcohol dehydrogenase family protein [Caballeronia sp. LZ024]MDR5845590.1 zinc-dependent alcohol dehydrogenase family protein [Caballeronia sp. LZ031]